MDPAASDSVRNYGGSGTEPTPGVGGTLAEYIRNAPAGDPYLNSPEFGRWLSEKIRQITDNSVKRPVPVGIR